MPSLQSARAVELLSVGAGASENDVLGFKSSALARDAFGYGLNTRLNFVEVFGHGVLPATDLGGDY